MTRASPHSTRSWKSQKWLGRLLGCVTAKGGGCSSSNIGNDGSDTDLSATHPPPADNNRNIPTTLNRHRPHRFFPLLGSSCHSGSSHSCNKRETKEGGKSIKDDVLLISSTLDAAPPVPEIMFGQLELALYAEGLLEYRDPLASHPVLTICYGFTNEELKALSKPLPVYSKSLDWTDQCQCARMKNCDELSDGRCCLEPFIDGLPASVWLECVEPTLSILISLNSLRHRRSNLSVKRGLPETLDSNRCRHGDFELGPIAIFQQPGRMQQMMLLRVEFLNAAAAAAAAVTGNDPDNNVNQSAEHTGRRTYNRHRRFRHAQSDEIDVENLSHMNIHGNNSDNSRPEIHHTELDTNNNSNTKHSGCNLNDSGIIFLDLFNVEGSPVLVDTLHPQTQAEASYPSDGEHVIVSLEITNPQDWNCNTRYTGTKYTFTSVAPLDFGAPNSETQNPAPLDNHMQLDSSSANFPAEDSSVTVLMGHLVVSTATIMLGTAVPGSAEQIVNLPSQATQDSFNAGETMNGPVREGLDLHHDDGDNVLRKGLSATRRRGITSIESTAAEATFLPPIVSGTCSPSTATHSTVTHPTTTQPLDVQAMGGITLTSNSGLSTASPHTPLSCTSTLSPRSSPESSWHPTPGESPAVGSVTHLPAG